jgi:hypothetical protein
MIERELVMEMLFEPVDLIFALDAVAVGFEAGDTEVVRDNAKCEYDRLVTIVFARGADEQ